MCQPSISGNSYLIDIIYSCLSSLSLPPLYLFCHALASSTAVVIYPHGSLWLCRRRRVNRDDYSCSCNERERERGKKEIAVRCSGHFLGAAWWAERRRLRREGSTERCARVIEFPAIISGSFGPLICGARSLGPSPRPLCTYIFLRFAALGWARHVRVLIHFNEATRAFYLCRRVSGQPGPGWPCACFVDYPMVTGLCVGGVHCASGDFIRALIYGGDVGG